MVDGHDEAVVSQRAYYARTAASYDDSQVGDADEHAMALAWMAAMIEQRKLKSVLDVGSGTGRALLYLQDRVDVRLLGVEPSKELREIGYGKGLIREQLIDGDALALSFPDNSFDLVCAFGVLHHIADHGRAVAEMARVARKAVFISDANNFGQGPLRYRTVKQALNLLGLWKVFDYVRTGFKGYHYSEGDGVFYSYSVHGDIPLIERKFPKIYYMSTRPSGPNLYRSAETIAVMCEYS
jgi:ubiquinone/menaquinone biosynthesis C-methylase UbiE